MFYNDKIIKYLQSNHILALKIDNAVSDVGRAVSNQIETIRGGAQRVLYYTSCFTDDYQDVCMRQKSEHASFVKGIILLIQKNDVVKQMIKLYFDTIFNYKT